MESVYHFDSGLHLWQVQQTGTDLAGHGPCASGSAALMEGNSYMFVEIIRHNDSVHFVEELQYTEGLDWRSPGVQILALLTTGHIYGGYREALREVSKVHETAGLVLEAGFVWVYVDGQMVYCRKDSSPVKPRLLARVHGFGHLRLIRPPPLSPCALGWCGVANGHITLCWGGQEEPRPSPELFQGPALRFEVARRWAGGGGYDLIGSRQVEDCVDQRRFPKRNDGGHPGSSLWWHCTGGDLEEFIGKELPGLFDGSTLLPF
ncbi:unnamed protein product [Symbiodinium sp. CCMP2456]|nr:unnamed protein product [Symbiodinium sp. CCMP2456]